MSTQTPRFNSGQASMIVLNSCKFRADRTSVSRGVFKKNLQIAGPRASRRLSQAQCNRRNRALHSPTHAATRMQHQVIRAKRRGPHNFLMECLHRPGSQHAIWRGQINQIIAVDDQRPQPQFLPSRPKSRRVRLRNANVPSVPHPWARRKYLQRIRAQPVRNFERAGKIARDGRMNPYSQASIFPRWNFGWWKRLGTILIGGVERQLDSMVVSAIPSGCPVYNHHFSRTVTTAQTRAHTPSCSVQPRSRANIFILQARRSGRLFVGASAGFFAPAAALPPIIGLGFQ